MLNAYVYVFTYILNFNIYDYKQVLSVDLAQGYKL